MIKESRRRVFFGISLVALLFLGPAVFSQEQHESVVVNIEVPVRVLKRGKFVDNLTMKDFEVFESGVRQEIKAVYLIKNTRILKEEKAPEAAFSPPRITRNLILYLDLKEFLPQVGKALDYFIKDVLLPDDQLIVATPVKTYKFKPEALKLLSRDQIGEQIKSKIKTDVKTGSATYRTLMRDFYSLQNMPYPPELAELKEMMLFDFALQIRDLTDVNESQLMDFADGLKSLNGQKNVFMIFQKEVMPDHNFSASAQAQLVKPVSFDVERIKRHYADASITVNFLYLTKIPRVAYNSTSGASSLIGPSYAFKLQDLSAPIYASFREMADSTGGLSVSSINPAASLKKAAETTSNYYLLYYRPINYRPDGGFRKIEIKLRGSGFRIMHRAGYIAD